MSPFTVNMLEVQVHKCKEAGKRNEALDMLHEGLQLRSTGKMNILSGMPVQMGSVFLGGTGKEGVVERGTLHHKYVQWQ